MIKKQKAYGKIISLAILVVILACALTCLIPHGHTSCEVNCALCELLETSRRVLTVTALTSFVYPLIAAISLAHLPQTQILLGADGTLVGLKVKLSN